MDNAGNTSALEPSGSVAPLWGEDLTGKTLADYQVLRRLGQGGMGQVYLAEQVSLKRKVALKFLRSDLAANPTSLQRFRHEAEAVAKATHSNIVQVYAVGELNGLHFMALEYIDGRNLREFIARKGAPELALALSIMRQTAAALQRAGELGIVHRDIKPENIMMTRKGEVKVADFGLSRCLAPEQQPLNLTQSGVTMGTPLYMSPEQVEGRALDPRSDIYSFGVTCYHMLAGQPPFRGQTAFEVALQHVQSSPPPLEQIRPDLPSDLCAIVRRMMAKKPDDRYQTCGELLSDLARIGDGISGLSVGQSGLILSSLDGEPIPLGVTVALKPRRRRRRWLPWLMAASLMLSAASGAALAWARFKKPSSPSTAAAPPADAVAVEALFSQQKREQFLRDAVEQYANPGKDSTRIRLGVGHCIELGLMYLDLWRLEEADELFARLTKSTVEQYVNVGRLGQAIVLGLQNQPAESNKAFVDLLKATRDQKAGPRQGLFLIENPQLAQWVARSLDFNAINAPSDFPKELQILRNPAGFPPRGLGKRAGLDKSGRGP